MFRKEAILELHTATHERIDLLLRHIATLPDPLCRKPIPGFGHPTVWKQLVHILTCEEGWVLDLQNRPFAGWFEEDCPTMPVLQAAKDRIRKNVASLPEQPHGSGTEYNPYRASRGLGRRIAQSGLYSVARDNSRISPQRPGGCDAENSWISGAGHGSAAGLIVMGSTAWLRRTQALLAQLLISQRGL